MKVLEGIDVDKYVSPEQKIDLLKHMEVDISEYVNTTVIPSHLNGVGYDFVTRYASKFIDSI